MKLSMQKSKKVRFYSKNVPKILEKVRFYADNTSTRKNTYIEKEGEIYVRPRKQRSICIEPAEHDE